MYIRPLCPNELYHGVKGQKWGIRRKRKVSDKKGVIKRQKQAAKDLITPEAPPRYEDNPRTYTQRYNDYLDRKAKKQQTAYKMTNDLTKPLAIMTSAVMVAALAKDLGVYKNKNPDKIEYGERLVQTYQYNAPDGTVRTIRSSTPGRKTITVSQNRKW